jgi:hypothetical protein
VVSVACQSACKEPKDKKEFNVLNEGAKSRRLGTDSSLIGIVVLGFAENKL